jgi:hypothetical protein
MPATAFPVYRTAARAVGARCRPCGGIKNFPQDLFRRVKPGVESHQTPQGMCADRRSCHAPDCACSKGSGAGVPPAHKAACSHARRGKRAAYGTSRAEPGSHSRRTGSVPRRAVCRCAGSGLYPILDPSFEPFFEPNFGSIPGSILGSILGPIVGPVLGPVFEWILDERLPNPRIWGPVFHLFCRAIFGAVPSCEAWVARRPVNRSPFRPARRGQRGPAQRGHRPGM